MKYSTFLPLSCDGCIHMRPEQGYLICNYCYDMDEPRGCEPADCDKYSKDVTILRPDERLKLTKYLKGNWERRQMDAHTD